MSDHTEDQPGKAAQRNWAELREWMNVFVAGAALLVAIVSFWTTTQISGLEDYFRSEISRRNSELNRLSDDSARVRQTAAAREERLSQLEASTNRVIATYIEAQGQLQNAESQLGRVQRQSLVTQQSLAESRGEAGSLRTEITRQRLLVDLFRRQRAFEGALLQITFGRGDRFEGDYYISGDQVLSSLNQVSAPGDSSELVPYFAEIREKAPKLCAYLHPYRPQVPDLVPWPDRPQRFGRPVQTPRGVAYEMTRKESELWDAEFDRWNADFGRVSKLRSDRSDYISSVSEYLRNSANRCACMALITAEHSANSICPGSLDRPQPPESNARKANDE